MKTPELSAEQIAHKTFAKLDTARELPTWPMSPTDLRRIMVAAIEADRAQRVDAVSAERKKIASMLMQQGDRMDGEGTQAGYYAAAHLVRERERSA